MTKEMNTKRFVLLPIFLLALAALLPWTPAARAYDYFGRYNTTATPNTLIPVKYDVSKLPNSTVTYYLTNQKPTAFAAGDSVEALMSEIALAASLWNGVSTSSLRVRFGGYTKQTGNGTPLNPMGIVSFTTSLPPGAAAAGGVLSGPASGNPPDFIPVALSYILLPADMSNTKSSSP